MPDGRLIGLVLVTLALGGLGYSAFIADQDGSAAQASTKKYTIAVSTEPALRMLDRTQATSPTTAAIASETLLVCRKVVSLGGMQLGAACRSRSARLADVAQ